MESTVHGFDFLANIWYEHHVLDNTAKFRSLRTAEAAVLEDRGRRTMMRPSGKGDGGLPDTMTDVTVSLSLPPKLMLMARDTHFARPAMLGIRS